MASHNVINPRYTLASTAHSQTLIKKGPRMQNTKTAWLLSLRIIGETNIPLFLQSNYNRFLIHYNTLGEIYVIN